MRVRYDRKAEAVRAWTSIAAIAICLRFAEHALKPTLKNHVYWQPLSCGTKSVTIGRAADVIAVLPDAEADHLTTIRSVLGGLA